MDAGLSPEEKKAVDEFAEKIDLRNSTAVSYTHLIFGKFSSVMGPALMGFVTQIATVVLLGRQSPVSYTHLDVYKRQIKSKPPFPPDFVSGETAACSFVSARFRCLRAERRPSAGLSLIHISGRVGELRRFAGV